MEQHKLRLAPQKTKSMTMKRNRKVPSFRLGVRCREGQGMQIPGRNDGLRSPCLHPRKGGGREDQKSDEGTQSHTPKRGNPSTMKRRALSHAVQTVLLYRWTVRVEVLRLKSCHSAVASIQRGMALRVSSGYNTVSTEAALAVGDTIPIPHLIADRRKVAKRG